MTGFSAAVRQPTGESMLVDRITAVLRPFGICEACGGEDHTCDDASWPAIPTAILEDMAERIAEALASQP